MDATLDEEAAAQGFAERYGMWPEEATAAELDSILGEMRGPERASMTHGGLTFMIDGESSDWVHVSGEGLPQPITVRLAVHRGRPRIVGFKMDNNTEVTADALRAVRLGQVLREFLRVWTPSAQPPNLRGSRPQDRDALLLDWAEGGIYLDRLPKIDSSNVVKAKRGTPPPSEVLQHFARILLEERLTQPHGAMARASRRCHIARSTAYRWAELCREHDYLPKEEEEDG